MSFAFGIYQDKQNGRFYFAEKILKDLFTLEEMVEIYPYHNKQVIFDEGYIIRYSEFIKRFERNDK